MKEFKEYIPESKYPPRVKGWGNVKTGKLVLTPIKGEYRPYHQQFASNNLSKLGLKDKDAIAYIDDSYGPPDEDDSKKLFQDIQSGKIDRDKAFEEFLNNNGWHSIVIDDGTSSIGDYKGTLRKYHKIAVAIHKKYGDSMFQSAGDYFEVGTTDIHNKYDWNTYIKTKKISGGRTEIGTTMAMFRGEERMKSFKEFMTEKTYAKSGLGKWMNQQSAGGGPGWDRYGTDGEKLGKCGDAKEGEPYSACLSKQKADKLGKKGIASFVRRKRYAQDKAKRGDIGDGGKGQKPINVKTGVTDKDPKKRGIQDEKNPRIPRKKGQPANSKQHSDLYTDENPEGTIHGLGFKDVETAKASVAKIKKSDRTHAHKIQAAIAMEQRAKEMGKTSEAAVYRKYIEQMKKKTKEMNKEDWSDKYKKSIDCNNPKGFSQRAHCAGKKESTMKSFKDYIEEKNVPDNPELWKKAIAKAKQKFDVYPSAYANAWAAKWYKGEGGTWSVKKESVELDEEARAFDNKNEAKRMAYKLAKKTGEGYTVLEIFHDAGGQGQLFQVVSDTASDEWNRKMNTRTVLRTSYNESVDECSCGCNSCDDITEAEYQGRTVTLNNPFRLPQGSKKKFGVYVKNDKGNIVKVTFGDPNMEIKRDDPARLKAFRSRHSCDDDPGPKWKARYWSCYQWRAGAKVDN